MDVNKIVSLFGKVCEVQDWLGLTKIQNDALEEPRKSPIRIRRRSPTPTRFRKGGHYNNSSAGCNSNDSGNLWNGSRSGSSCSRLDIRATKEIVCQEPTMPKQGNIWQRVAEWSKRFLR